MKWGLQQHLFKLELLFTSGEQRKPLTVVVAGKDVVTLLPTGFDGSHCALMFGEEASWQLLGINIYCNALRF